MQRYEISITNYGDTLLIEPNEEGEWVKHEDVKKEIQSFAYDLNHYKQKCWQYENKGKEEEE